MRFLQIHRNGKYWLLSRLNINQALCLFHPTNWKGKLLSVFIRQLSRIHLDNLLPSIRIVDYELDEFTRSLIEMVYDVHGFDYSIYSNVEGITSKQTIQIVDRDKIVGYCQKYDSTESMMQIQNESKFLQYLYERNITNIPISKYTGVINNNAFFCQSTQMTHESTFCYSWSDLHTDFLRQLYLHTKEVKSFEETDYYRLLMKYEDVVSSMKNKRDAMILISGVQNIISFYSNRNVEFGACHWDFTPWNMFVEKGRLFVFDWEFAQYDFPPYIDYFHFFTQNCILVKGINNPQDIYSLYIDEKQKIDTLIDAPGFTYVCYLVAIIIFYFREHKDFSEDDMCCRCWLELLNILNYTV